MVHFIHISKYILDYAYLDIFYLYVIVHSL